MTNKKIGFTYKPLLKLLKDRKISMNSLKEKYDISSATIDRVKHDKVMTIYTILYLMGYLEIDNLNDVIEFHVEDGDNEDQI